MKKIFAIIMTLIVVQVQAQEDNTTQIDSTVTITPGDTTRVKLGRYNLTIIEKEGEKDEVKFHKEEIYSDEDEYGSDWPTEDQIEPRTLGSKERTRLLTHWSGVNFGMNGYIGTDPSLRLPDETSYMELDYSGSFSFSVNYPELKVKIFKDYVGIYTGLGLQFNSYRLRQDVTLKFNGEVTHFVDTARSFTRNTLQMYYLRVPLMLEFNTSSNPLKTVHLSAGVVGGFRLASTYIQNYQEGRMDYKTSTSGVKNLNLFTGELMVRAGYSHFVMYASYGLTPIFAQSEGPEIYPISVGLGFSF
jgi:hypothetical protein